MEIKNFKSQINTFQTNKGLTGYSVWADVLYQGNMYQGAAVTAFKEGLIQQKKYDTNINNVKFEFKQKKDGSGQFPSFVIYAEKKEFSKFQKTSYTLEEFMDLWNHTTGVCKTDAQIDTFFRCATVSGVKIKKENNEQKTKEEEKGKVLDFPNFQDQEFSETYDDPRR